MERGNQSRSISRRQRAYSHPKTYRSFYSKKPPIFTNSPPQWLFLQAAERINEILHVGGINKNDRAKTIAALLLSVVEQPPNLETKLPVFLGGHPNPAMRGRLKTGHVRGPRH